MMTNEEMRKMLENQNLTIQALSEKIGVSERMIKYYLSGKYPVPKKVALAIKAI